MQSNRDPSSNDRSESLFPLPTIHALSTLLGSSTSPMTDFVVNEHIVVQYINISAICYKSLCQEANTSGLRMNSPSETNCPPK